MKKGILLAIIVAISLLTFAGSASAALPGNFALIANGGYMFSYGELELEYKEGVGSIGVNVGSDGKLLEIGVPIKYFVPMNYGFSFYVDVNPALLVLFAGPAVQFGIKAGPGLEYRAGMFKAQVEGGYAYALYRGHWFYVKGGVGFVF